MGCNTSKEAMQTAAENAEAAAKAAENPETQRESEIETISSTEIVDNVDNVKSELVVPNSVNVDKEQLENAVIQNKENILAEKTEKARETLKKGVKLDVTDIDPNDPEANRAATKIQAAFRGHQTRKNMKQGDAESKENLEKEFSSDDKELCEAATKIQASFRGHLVRKSAPRKDEEEELSRELKKLDAKAPEEELDIDLTDPDLQVAATKIQASFRGHRVRKEKQGGNE